MNEIFTKFILGKDVNYDVLAILDFDNVRKRMSVIVKNEQGLFFFCTLTFLVIDLLKIDFMIFLLIFRF